MAAAAAAVTASASAKTYDLILFGMTGFTGKLAVEYMLQKQQASTSTAKQRLSWAVCARNKTKAAAILADICNQLGQPAPPLLIANLTPSNDDNDQETLVLRQIVQSTRVVVTTAGPFEKYGMVLHQLCAQQGVHYADITGESSFVRQVVMQHDAVARQTKACLVSHCGADCIPQDLTVWEMHQHAVKHGCTLTQVTTLDELPSTATMSGGTLTTAVYQLSKPKHDKTTTATATVAEFDPLVTLADGTKSPYATRVTHKSRQFHAPFGRHAGPWIMGPVMANCVRRSNALLGYNAQLVYGDACLDDPNWINRIKAALYTSWVGASLYFAPLQALLPQPGQGPDRATMEAGYLKLHGFGVMTKNRKHDHDDGQHDEEPISIYSQFHFKHDVAYFMTAQLLMEAGMLLVEKDKAGTLTTAGVVTPAVAFGSELTQRITQELDATFCLQDSPIIQN